MKHLDLVGRDAEVIRDDLGERRLVSLPVRARARDGGDAARALDLEAAALPAERAGLDVGRDPNAHDLPAFPALRLPAAEAGIVGRLERLIEGQW
jgi:hypothetical protein